MTSTKEKKWAGPPRGLLLVRDGETKKLKEQSLSRVEVGGEAAKSYKSPFLKHKTDIEPDSYPNKSELFQKATHVTR